MKTLWEGAMVPRRPGSPVVRGAPLRAALLLFGLAALLAGCGTREKKAPPAVSSAAADTTAWREATALSDTTAQMAALREMLQKRPGSPFRTAAYTRLEGLMAARTPDQVIPFLREAVRTEKQPDARSRLYLLLYEETRDRAPQEESLVLDEIQADPTLTTDVYNPVAWDLVERHRDLDRAARLAAIGVERAADSTSKANVLDTEGWAWYLGGDYEKAVDRLQAASALTADPEVREHLAEAYDKAGRKAEARDLYKELLYSEEDPDWRARLVALTRDRPETGSQCQTGRGFRSQGL
jgi:tetratricopeptide (TPR) repeat protein